MVVDTALVVVGVDVVVVEVVVVVGVVVVVDVDVAVVTFVTLQPSVYRYDVYSTLVVVATAASP